MSRRLVLLVLCLCPWNIVEGQIGGAPSGQQPSRAQQLPLSGRTDSGSVTSSQTPATGPGGATSVNTINPSIEVQGSFEGSTPTGSASSRPLSLTLEDAIKRGLTYNLGAIGAGEAGRLARAQRLAAVAQLLPDVLGNVHETVQQIDLAAQGLRINLPIPGFHFPAIVGPFNYFDLRANLSENVSLTNVRNWRSSQEIAALPSSRSKTAVNWSRSPFPDRICRLPRRLPGLRPRMRKLKAPKPSINRLSTGIEVA